MGEWYETLDLTRHWSTCPLEPTRWRSNWITTDLFDYGCILDYLLISDSFFDRSLSLLCLGIKVGISLPDLQSGLPLIIFFSPQSFCWTPRLSFNTPAATSSSLNILILFSFDHCGEFIKIHAL